ncbi:proline dehydrogenase [Skeletonema marinoi]|uniref:Proline dehydrogenase n=1 Tax=Skeletonema marinoi TaxID=267567 RepID=A0AAD8YLT5_9STRA|nr:proline dehydrogenase [Skeletonema marinoi]
MAEKELFQDDAQPVRRRRKKRCYATAYAPADDPSAHGSKSAFELLTAIGVFSSCRLPFLIRNAEYFLDLSYKTLGHGITNAVMKHTFFRHFCAGEDRHDMKPNNIGPILDYAAENDCADSSESAAGLQGIFSQPPFNQPARVYDYKSEEECDRHVSIFQECIHSVHDVSPVGFAALKVTALGNPELLERMSTMIVEVKNLFAKFQPENGSGGLISREEFAQCYRQHFHVGADHLEAVIESLDPNDTGVVDFISFAEMLTPYNLPSFTFKCKSTGPLARVTPSSDEIVLMKRMSERLHTLAADAALNGTRLLIDAEHQKYQPAIDNLVVELQKKFNAKDKTDRPIIFNTYQCYLKDTLERVEMDLKRSERYSFHLGAKLVRGAYMEHERERSKNLQYPCPIHDTAEDTHQCYDEVVEYLMRYRWQNGSGTEIMVASHNQASIEKAVVLMNQLGLQPQDPNVYFAQLFGMRDNLSFPLGSQGYNVFKYLPYGKVEEVMPYLLRRAAENSAVLGDSVSELDMLKEALYKRIIGR